MFICKEKNRPFVNLGPLSCFPGTTRATKNTAASIGIQVQGSFKTLVHLEIVLLIAWDTLLAFSIRLWKHRLLASNNLDARDRPSVHGWAEKQRHFTTARIDQHLSTFYCGHDVNKLFVLRCNLYSLCHSHCPAFGTHEGIYASPTGNVCQKQ